MNIMQRNRQDIFRVMDEEILKSSREDVRSRRYLLPRKASSRNHEI